MILNFLSEGDFIFQKTSNTNGGEYAGPCPFCGGRDRFRVWPEYKGGRWWCRQCEKSGDAIQYLRECRGMSYWEAKKIVGHTAYAARRSALQRPVQEEGNFLRSGDLWQGKASELLREAEENLCAVSDDPDSIDFDGFVQDDGTIPSSCTAALRSRGMSADTIKKSHLGWLGFQQKFMRSKWGLPDGDGGQKMLIIPSGLLIPTYNSNGCLIRIRIRRKIKYKDSHYYLVPGSSLVPVILQGGDNSAVVVCESELDGLLLHQEAAALVAVVALGSTTIKPDTMTNDLLQQADRILLSFDNDAAGVKASNQFIETYGSKAVRWPVPYGKDPGEAYQQGLNIRTWIEAGLQRQ